MIRNSSFLTNRRLMMPPPLIITNYELPDWKPQMLLMQSNHQAPTIWTICLQTWFLEWIQAQDPIDWCNQISHVLSTVESMLKTEMGRLSNIPSLSMNHWTLEVRREISLHHLSHHRWEILTNFLPKLARKILSRSWNPRTKIKTSLLIQQLVV